MKRGERFWDLSPEYSTDTRPPPHIISLLEDNIGYTTDYRSFVASITPVVDDITGDEDGPQIFKVKRMQMCQLYFNKDQEWTKGDDAAAFLPLVMTWHYNIIIKITNICNHSLPSNVTFIYMMDW
jgi:hypothetical protein